MPDLKESIRLLQKDVDRKIEEEVHKWNGQSRELCDALEHFKHNIIRTSDDLILKIGVPDNSLARSTCGEPPQDTKVGDKSQAQVIRKQGSGQPGKPTRSASVPTEISPTAPPLPAKRNRTKAEAISNKARLSTAQRSEDVPSYLKALSLPSSLPPKEELLKRLSPKMAWLFYSIASFDVFKNIQNAVKKMNSAGSSAYSASNIRVILSRLNAIDSTEKSFVSMVVRRYYLSCLCDDRDRKKQEFGRTHGIIEKLMKEAYPDIIDEGREKKKIMKTIANRLSEGRKWQKIKQKFNVGVLALIPTDLPHGLANSDIQKLANTNFDKFLEFLERHRGDALKYIGGLLAPVLEALSTGNAGNKRFKVELQNYTATRQILDSDELRSICRVRELEEDDKGSEGA